MNIKYTDIEKDIHDSIDKIIDQYLLGRTSGTKTAINVLTKDDYDKYFDGKKKTIFDAEKDFRSDRAINQLIKDIKSIGYKEFSEKHNSKNADDIKSLYKKLVTNITNEIIQDRKAATKDKNNKYIMKEVKSFDEFKKLNEIKLPILKIDEILDDVSVIKNNTLRSVLVTFYKTFQDYIDLVSKKHHQFRINDLSGDILNNNRVSFDAYIYDINDINQIRKNIIDYSVGEFLSNLPLNINVFGMDLKTSSFINKEELKTSFEMTISLDETINIISAILNFKFESKFNDFYIFSSKK